MNEWFGLLRRLQEWFLLDWLENWPLRHWPESPIFIIGTFIIMVVGGMFPLDIPPKRYIHYSTGVAGVAAFFIMGPRAIWVLLAATVVRNLIYHTIWPRRWREWSFQRIANQPFSVGWALLSAIAAMLATHWFHLKTGDGQYPVPIGEVVLDLKYAFLLLVLCNVYLVMSEFGVWLRHRQRPRELLQVPPLGVLYSDIAVFITIAVLVAPLNYAAVKAYDPRYPNATMFWMSWGFYLSFAVQILIQRREQIVNLVRELELKQKLAAVGEVSARIAHQSRHELGLFGMSLHQIERHAKKLPEPSRSLLHEELFRLEVMRTRLSRMLTNVLRTDDDMTEGGAGAVPYRTVMELAAVETERLAPRAAELGIRLELKVSGDGQDTSTLRDPEQFSQGLFNVIDNALSAARHTVTIEVTTKGRETEITVMDDGPGMTGEVLTRATDPFFTTKSGGTGMGLAVARAVADAEGGILEIRNRSEGGLEVMFRLGK